MDHTKDSDCDVNPETMMCRECGVYHGLHCMACGGGGFHAPDCPYNDANAAVGANILKRAIHHLCADIFERSREDALDILNEALEQCFDQEPQSPADLTEASAGFKCRGCGRDESVCSANPCDGVVADRDEMPVIQPITTKVRQLNESEWGCDADEKRKWAPLDKLLGDGGGQHFFMYMGECGDLVLYKHVNTRRYLNIDRKTGETFKHTAGVIPSGYEPIPHTEALEHVLAAVSQ